eukprot:1494054-Rhodomonas_salina.2
MNKGRSRYLKGGQKGDQATTHWGRSRAQTIWVCAQRPKTDKTETIRAKTVRTVYPHPDKGRGASAQPHRLRRMHNRAHVSPGTARDGCVGAGRGASIPEKSKLGDEIA